MPVLQEEESGFYYLQLRDSKVLRFYRTQVGACQKILSKRRSFSSDLPRGLSGTYLH